MGNHFKIALLGLLALGLFNASDALAKGKGSGKGKAKTFQKQKFDKVNKAKGQKFNKVNKGGIDDIVNRGSINDMVNKGGIDIHDTIGNRIGNNRAFGQDGHPGLHLGQKNSSKGVHLGHENQLRAKGEKGLGIGNLDGATMEDIKNLDLEDIGRIPLKELLSK